jgi:hypothetical protein
MEMSCRSFIVSYGEQQTNNLDAAVGDAGGSEDEEGKWDHRREEIDRIVSLDFIFSVDILGFDVNDLMTTPRNDRSDSSEQEGTNGNDNVSSKGNWYNLSMISNKLLSPLLYHKCSVGPVPRYPLQRLLA